jgi:hypothetical protein
MKLTQKEQRVIKALQDGKCATYFPYQGRFNPHRYYNVDGVGKCTREMDKLIKLGLVEMINKGLSNHKISLTEEGKKFQCELDEPYDVWVCEKTYKAFIHRYKGFLKGSNLTLAKGGVVREQDNRKFFLDRGEAFAYALNQQKQAIRIAESKVKQENERILEILKHLEHPEHDTEGYL